MRLDPLIPQGEARVRKDKHTREPAPSSAEVTPEASSSSGTAHHHQWDAEGQGKGKGKQSPDSLSSWSSRRNEWRE